jgi:glutaredoxin 3
MKHIFLMLHPFSSFFSSQVMVFARSYGPHNQQTKDLLKEMAKKLRVHVEYVDLDLMPGFDGSLIMTELQRISGQWALPNIFIGKKHVGGNSELEQLRGLGMLEAMILEAGDEL